MRAVGDSLGELGLARTKMGLGMEEMKYLPMKMQLEILQQAQNGVDTQQTGQHWSWLSHRQCLAKYQRNSRRCLLSYG